ncbi:MAG: DUF4129 domain-containing protein [Gammaproteobacteria bacterium]|nr:DUF4129 domain-containing protein [Gammaproteobacteria bacterium]MDH5803135.1 DUF4129 domain-containing protein [Gammaproteobacteria bacterium]
MDLSRIGIIARERNAWEALDLGVLLARKQYRALVLAWLLPSLPVFVLLTVLFYDSLWIGITITWWLKPIWDRVPLYMASRSLFGETVTVPAALRAMWSFAWKDSLAWLTWRRFSFSRSFDMPVTLLEGLKGTPRRQRLRVLHIESSNAATWLTAVCIHLEAALLLGAVGMIYMFIPEEVDFNWLGFIESEEQFVELLANSLSYTAMVLIAPFYTLSGFSLYISRRISLEGWDIEIRFRHLAARQLPFGQSGSGQSSPVETSNKSAVGSVAQLILLLFLGLMCFPAAEGYAQEQQATPVEPAKFVLTPAAQRSQEDIEQVLKGKDFNQEITETHWRFKNSKDLQESDQIPEWLINFIEFLEKYQSESKPDDEKSNISGLAILLAKMLEILLWVGVVVLVVFLVYHYRDYIKSLAKGMRPSRKPKVQPPEILFGLDVRKESLPENVPDKVLSIWQSGAAREALGLLYRATLSRLIHQYHIEFNESHTEKECADIVHQSALQELDVYMQKLTRIWQRLAYGHRMPEESDVVALCRDWPGIFSHEA